MNLWQRFKLWLRGYVYIDHRRRPGWSGPLPFYMLKCPVHGIVENYPSGYSRRLDCPLCQEEARENAKPVNLFEGIEIKTLDTLGPEGALLVSGTGLDEMGEIDPNKFVKIVGLKEEKR